MATPSQLLDGEAFNQLVLEEGLKTWEQDGYIYTGKRGVNGWELYRTYGPKIRFLWTYRQVCTQDNVAGGNLVARVTLPTGQTCEPQIGAIQASGNRAVYVAILDADANQHAYLANVGAAAGAKAVYPNAGGGYTVTNGAPQAISQIYGGGCIIHHQVTAAAQTETAVLNLIFLLSSNTRPTVSWATSGGTPNAAVATEDSLDTVLRV